MIEPSDEQLEKWRREAAEEGERLRAAQEALSRPLLELAVVLKRLGATGADVTVEGIPSPTYAGDNEPLSAHVSINGFGIILRT